MDKQILKSILEKVQAGSELEINFVNTYENLSGKYKVIESKIGRGQGGSRVVKLENLETKEILESILIGDKKKLFGSSTSDCVLNLSVDGNFYGDSEMTDFSITHPKNKEGGEQLREALKHLTTATDKGAGKKIKIQSVDPSINGDWTIKMAYMSPGRFGQVVLKLENKELDKVTEFWTYRHSGVVEGIELED